MTKKIPRTVKGKVERVDAIVQQIIALREEADAVLKKAQAQCPHPIDRCVEGRYKRSDFFTFKPFTVCRDCGYAEQQWGAGLWKLAHTRFKAPEMDRDEAWKFVRTFVTQDEMRDLGRYGL